MWKWKDPGNPLRLNAKDEKDRLPQDTGCDLVAQTPDGGYYAIQCKYYLKRRLGAGRKVGGEKVKNKKLYRRENAVTLSHLPITLTESMWEGVNKAQSV